MRTGAASQPLPRMGEQEVSSLWEGFGLAEMNGVYESDFRFLIIGRGSYRLGDEPPPYTGPDEVRLVIPLAGTSAQKIAALRYQFVIKVAERTT